MNESTLSETLTHIEEMLEDPSTMSLPDPELVNYYKMLQERKIWIDSIIDFSMTNIERTIMMWNMEDKDIPVENRKPIWLYIMSYGGIADCAWSLIDVITASETPIYTVNMGQCASAASYIFMAGHKRYMMPTATVLIHEGSCEFEGDAVKVIDASKNYQMMLKHMREYILSRTNIPASTLNKKRNNDWELNLETCLKYSVCDQSVEKLSEILW